MNQHFQALQEQVRVYFEVYNDTSDNKMDKLDIDYITAARSFPEMKRRAKQCQVAEMLEDAISAFFQL